MPKVARKQEAARYLIELRSPDGGFLDINELASRSRAACRELTAEGTPMRFLRSVFVPEDGSCLLVLEAASAESVRGAMRRAGLPSRRITKAEVVT